MTDKFQTHYHYNRNRHCEQKISVSDYKKIYITIFKRKIFHLQLRYYCENEEELKKMSKSFLLKTTDLQYSEGKKEPIRLLSM